MRIAFTVVPERNRLSRCGVASTKCLNRAKPVRLIEDQSTPWSAHQPRKFATRPAYARIVCGDRPAPCSARRKSLASRCITNPQSSTTHNSDPSSGDTARSAWNPFTCQT